MQKYKIVGKSIVYNDGSRVATLYRIKALRDIPRHGVKAGDLGGWIHSEANLSQFGDAWVGEEAKVFENAYVFGNAIVKGNAIVYWYSLIFGNAKVYGNASLVGNLREC